jgi:SAM-dependent methyltransferase
VGQTVFVGGKQYRNSQSFVLFPRKQMIRPKWSSYFKLSRKLLSSTSDISAEAIIWAYRLFLDREPENVRVITDRLNRFKSLQELRQEFIKSEEFKQNNPGFVHLSMSGCEPGMFIESISDLNELFFHIQNVWEHLGETEPYWSVATHEDFKLYRIKDTQREFYNSGFDNVDALFKTFERNGIDHSSFKTCLEYGCGLGRVTCWLARRFETVIGYDISRPHLLLAKQYLTEMGIDNVSLQHLRKPQAIGNFPQVDVVYSVIVLQHNPPPIIRLIVQEMMRALRSGGIAYFQVPTYRLGYRFALQEYLACEAARGEMEMHVLSQKEIFDIVTREQGKIVEVLEDGWTGVRQCERSNTFVIQKT